MRARARLRGLERPVKGEGAGGDGGALLGAREMRERERERKRQRIGAHT